MKKILIKQIKHDQIKLHMEGSPSIDEAMAMIFTAALSIMKNAVANAPEDKQEEVRELLYDTMNESASAVLDAFIPEKDLRPDLTYDAIKQYEREQMKKHIAKAKKIGALQ